MPYAFYALTHLIQLRRRQITDYSTLISDIFSLNISRIPSPNPVAREKVGSFLKEVTTNPEVTQIFEQQTASIQEITNCLMTMRPFHCPFAHEILKYSNAGLLLRF